MHPSQQFLQITLTSHDQHPTRHSWPALSVNAPALDALKTFADGPCEETIVVVTPSD
jgi:hypothetical protein